MRVLILVDCYLPSRKSGAKLIYDLGAEFKRQGHEVTILTITHQMAHGFDVSVEDGLRIARVKTRQIKGAPKLLRGFSETRLPALVWRRAHGFLVDNPADLIVFYSPTIFWGALVRRLKELWNAPAYLILRDIFPKWAVDTGVLSRGLVYHYLRKKEIQQYESADVIAVQSPGDLKYFAHDFADRFKRVEVLYNWTNLDEPKLPSTSYRIQMGLQEKIVFFYGGNLGAAQDVDNLVRLAARLTKDSRIHFLLVGEGSEVPRLKKSIEAQGLRNIQVLPPRDQHEYLSMLSEFDVGLLSLHGGLRTHNIPGKLLGYMYCSKPVLASVNFESDLFELIGRNQMGLCVVNGDDDGLCAAALQLTAELQQRTEMGRNARLLLERTFGAGTAVRQILQHVSGMGRRLAQAEVLTVHS